MFPFTWLHCSLKSQEQEVWPTIASPETIIPYRGQKHSKSQEVIKMQTSDMINFHFISSWNDHMSHYSHRQKTWTNNGYLRFQTSKTQGCSIDYEVVLVSYCFDLQTDRDASYSLE